MNALLFVVALSIPSTTAASDGALHTIFVTDFTRADVQEETTEILQGLMTAEIARTPGVSVLSTRELRATLDAAADSATGACTQDSACFAELAAGLGARYLVLGATALANGLLSLELSLLDLEDGTVRAREVVVGRDLTDVHTRISLAAQNLLAPLTGNAAKPIPPPTPFRRFDDTSSLLAMTGTALLAGGTSALLGVAGFAGFAGMAALLTETDTTLGSVFMVAGLAAFASIPAASALVAALASYTFDLFVGGERVVSRALLLAALVGVSSVPLGGVLVASSIVGQPIGWVVGMEFSLFDNENLNERYRAMFLGSAATGALGALVLVGALSAGLTAGAYAFGVYVLEEVEPEGEIVASLDDVRRRTTLALDVE